MVVGIAVLSAFVITRQMPDKYRAKGELTSGMLDLTLVSTDNVDGGAFPYYGIGPRYGQWIEMLSSDQVLSLLTYRLMLHDLERPEPFRRISEIQSRFGEEKIRSARNFFRQKLDDMEPLSPRDPEEFLDMISIMGYQPNRLDDALEIEIDQATEYLSVTFLLEKPELSAYAVNQLCEYFTKYFKQVEKKHVEDAIEYLSRLATTKKRTLDLYANTRLKTTYANQEKQFLDRVRKSFTEQHELELVMQEEQKTIRTLQRVLRSIDQILTDEDRKAWEKAISSRENEILRQEVRLGRVQKELLKRKANKIPEAELADSVNLIRNRIQRFIVSAAYPDPSVELESQDRIRHKSVIWVKLKESKLVARLVDERLKELKNQAGWQIYMSTKDEEMTHIQDDYIAVIGKLNQARLTALNPGNPVIQVSKASVPATPEPTQNAMLIALSGGISLGICIILIFLLEYVDVSIRTPYLLNRFTGLKPIGTLNLLNSQQLDLPEIFKGKQNDPSLETFKQHLRKIRFEIISSNAKTVLFTSTQPRVGKSSLLLALAYSLSLNHKKVLVIDSNIKDPDLTSVTFAKPTLEKFFSREISKTQLISHSGLSGVDVIGSAGNTSSPSELFDALEFRQLIHDLSNKYDYIFFEGPSLNAFPDTKELIQYTDKVVAVFSARSTIKQGDRESISFLKKLENQLLGAVLNYVSEKDMA